MKKTMIALPVQSFRSFARCYDYLLKIFHPTGFCCPCGHPVADTQKPHKFRANGLPCYRCRDCKKVFNICYRCYSAKEFARDDDDDGINEVHCNSCEGLRTEVRNFLRPFKGVHKKYLAQYIAVFENASNFREHLKDFIRAMLIPDFFLDNYVLPQFIHERIV